MYFGVGPLGFGFGYNNNNQQGQQGQQGQPFFGQQQPQPPPNQQQPNNNNNNNNLGGFINGIFDNFMNPFMQGNNQQRQQQQQQQQQEPRPTFFTKSKNDKKPSNESNSNSNSVKSQSSGYQWKVKGNEAYSKGRYEQAIIMYTQAIEMNSIESIYYSNRAQAYKKIGKYTQSLKDAQEAIELDTTNARGHILAGQCLAQIGNRDDNLKKLENAIVRLTKALTLSGGGKRLEIEKEASRYIYLAKKVIFYIKFNQVRNARLKALQEYQEYLRKDDTMDNDTKQKKMQQFLYASDEKIIFTIPEYLTCKITFELMEDPVVTDSGQCYQRYAIEEHMQRNGRTDPFTRQPIKGPLYPCISVKKAVSQFLERNPWAYEFSEGQNYKDIHF